MTYDFSASDVAVRPVANSNASGWDAAPEPVLPRFENAASAPATLSRQLIEDGAMAILSDFADKQPMLQLIKQSLYETVEEIAGRECRTLVEQDGIDQLHVHFPVDKVKQLQAVLEQKIGHDLYRWAGKVGTQDLKLGDDFFIDHLIMLRIHYPYRSALKAKRGNGGLKAKRGLARFMNKRGGYSRMTSAVRRKFRLTVIKLSQLDHQAVSYDLKKYFRNQPEEAWVHGPHIDTWYGHSYDGINLWWAIAGVTEETGMNMYPSLFGEPLKFSPVSMYLDSGQPLPRPIKTPLRDGELLVFNPEILHSTQLNIADKTRFVITLRLNPAEPKFDTDAVWNFADWYRWRDVKAGRFQTEFFPAHKFPGEPRRSGSNPAAAVLQKSSRIRVRATFRDEPEHRVCDVDAIAVGEKALVVFNDTSVLLIRGTDDVHVISSACPHVGVGLQDGYHDEKFLFCPGHGLKFDYRTGESDCGFLKVRKFNAEIRDGIIFVGAPPETSRAPADIVQRSEFLAADQDA
jgi:nitrite reductase/ring-hydroxylating ferredoxin subunit